MTQAAPRSKIAMVNILGVIKKYNKAKMYEDHIRNAFQEADKRFDAKKAELQRLKAEGENPNTPGDKKPQIEKDFKRVQREMQDLDEEMKQWLGKVRGDMAVTIYKEIEEAVSLYARSKDVELVFQYFDALEKAD